MFSTCLLRDRQARSLRAGQYILLGLLVAFGAPALSAEDASFNRAVGLAGAADARSVLDALAALPTDVLKPGQQQLRTCMQTRLSGAAPLSAAPPVSGFAGDVLRAFRRYWVAAMQTPSARAQAEADLQSALQGLLPETKTSSESEALSELTDAARTRMSKDGWFSLAGVTPPLRELMLWRKQTELRETVQLPTGPQAASVFLLEDFVSLGWLAWATCDHHHTAGWVSAEGIMAVAGGWNRQSENFRVSLLGHEAQHFQDKQRFPNLSDDTLEFRAKLTELVLAQTLQPRLLARFRREAANAADQTPHANGARQLLAALVARHPGETLERLSRDALAESSKAALLQDSETHASRRKSVDEGLAPMNSERPKN